MKRLNQSKITLLIVAFVLALMLTAGSAKADFTFGEPVNLGPTVNSSVTEGGPSISADGLSLYFTSTRPGGYGSGDVYVATRASTEGDWGPAVNLGPTVNSSSGEGEPSISADGLSLYFASDRPPGSGLWVTTRATLSDPWGPPISLGPTVNSSGAIQGCLSISADGLSLYFASNRAGGYGSMDIWVTKRATLSDPWGPPANLGPPVNSSTNDYWPSISADGLTLFFERGPGTDDLWVTRRAILSDPWGSPVNLGPQINTLADDACPNISADGCTLYFSSDRPGGYGGYDIWQASIEPVVDLNGDGVVDSADICIVVDHWGEDDPLCDIGPMPWGDGVVDVQDLIILAEHLFENELAHWKLDEAEGMVAHDSVSNNDAFVIGVPVWQPTGGQVDGALQLDGIDDCAVTNPILNPAEGPFSVFVWVRGGAPGQVVLSQIGSVNWLCMDTLEGNLMTELKGPGRGAILLSQAVITDGNWHRIGLVWDGSHRKLFVDGVVVAEDTQAGLEGSDNGLYIGTGEAMEAGTYWSGLIDDVRIYNRAVKP